MAGYLHQVLKALPQSGLLNPAHTRALCMRKVHCNLAGSIDGKSRLVAPDQCVYVHAHVHMQYDAVQALDGDDAAHEGSRF